MGLNENRLAKHTAEKAARTETMLGVLNRRIFGRGTSYVRKKPVSEFDRAQVLKAEQKRQRKRNRRATEKRGDF